ncbi:MAG: hypothetical protein IT342_00780 [Candidatus Melainabacteria bacterium]|nr:hypothetical protein [Candidatus Melainabacteria bacterium]
MNAITTTTSREADRSRMSAILQRVENDPTEGVVFFDEIGGDNAGALDLPAGWTEADAREMAAEACAEHNALRGYSLVERQLIKAGRLHGEDVLVTRSRRVH